MHILLASVVPFYCSVLLFPLKQHSSILILHLFAKITHNILHLGLFILRIRFIHRI